MNVQILSDKKSPLLGRRDVEFQLVSKTTPQRKELKPALAQALKADEKVIIIDYIKQKTGANIATGRAKVYESEALLKELTLEYKTKRGTGEKKGGKEKQAKPAEKPKA